MKNERIEKTFKIFTITLVLVLMLLVVIFSSTDHVAMALQLAEAQENVVIDIPSPNDNFADDSVLVVMDKETSAINKVYSLDYFGDIAIESIEDLTYIEGGIDNEAYLDTEKFHQILQINLLYHSKQYVIDTIIKLSDVNGICVVEPNYYAEPVALPAATKGDRYSALWGLHGSNGIGAEEAWNFSTGNKEVVRVGILDTGIAEHPDLEGNLVEGWDFVNDNNVTSDDPNGHGTHVAGIIGATGNNVNGVVGVCPNVQLVPLQIVDTTGMYPSSAISSAIMWAAVNDIDIINYSGYIAGNSASMQMALQMFQGLFVCSSGNGINNDGNGVDSDKTPHYPSIYSIISPHSYHVMSVGSINASGERSSFSNYGALTVSIFAPGGSILSTVPTSDNLSGYAYKSGTSMAAPYVTGVAALMYAILENADHGLTIQQKAATVKAAIIDGATYSSNLDGLCVADGRLDASGAIAELLFIMSELSDGTLRIDSMRYQYDGDLYIPEEINGKSVAHIANAAFLNQTGLESISIPAGVTFIGANAFQGCTSLQSITFEEGSLLTTIGNGAFYGCSALFNVTLPEYVTAIGANTFENCTALGTVHFHENSRLESIGNSAFSGSNLVLSMTIPAGVTTIGANAYQNATLGTLSFESGSQLTSIGNAAFAGCETMTYMTLPTGLESIGYDVFSGCIELMSVAIPDSVTSIGGNAFAGCTNLTIYTEYTNPPAGWIGGWNSLNRPIVLGCTLSDDGAIVSFTKTDSNPFNANATGGVMNPSRSGYSFGGWYTTADFSGTKYDDIASAPNGTLYAKWNENACVAAGTLITLADGRQVPVESLTGNEMLLVWNLFTGEFDVAPILFIDSEAAGMYEVVTLAFSDGTTLKVIDEHALWDFDLNEYVFMRSDAAKYIGHWFNKQSYDADGNMIYTRVQLTGVTVTTEYTSAWSPVTYGHLCFYVNGMLSMPGATTGLINIFDVDPDTMTIDEEQYLADIETYGLFTYEEFAALYPVPEEIFDAFGGQYLKVAMGKGLLTEDMISILINRYSEFFV